MDRSRFRGEVIDSDLVNCLSMASELQPLHPLHRVTGIAIGQGVLLEGLGDLTDCISHAVAGLEACGQQIA